MTRERALELARTAINRTHACGGVASIADSILAAVAEEREECAKIADAQNRGGESIMGWLRLPHCLPDPSTRYPAKGGSVDGRLD